MNRDSRSLKFRLLVATLLTIATSALAPQAIANPSSKDPTKWLVTHNLNPEAASILQKIREQYEPFQKFVLNCDETIAKRGLNALPAKEMGAWKLKAISSFRELRRLEMMGEPAMADADHYMAGPFNRLTEIMDNFVGTPQGLKIAQKILAQLEKQKPSVDKRCAEVMKKADAGQFVEAQVALDAIGNELDAVIYYIGRPERPNFYTSYTNARSRVDLGRAELYCADTIRLADEAIQKNMPDFNALKTWADQVAAQLKASGKATIEGKGELQGPATLDALAERWTVTHAALQRIQGLRWIKRWALPVGLYITQRRPYNNFDDSIEKETKALTDGVMSAITTIIKADAEAIQASDVAARHQSYLVALTKLAIAGEADEIYKAGNEGLSSLLAKDSVYETTVKNYEGAMADLFVFERRIAQQAEVAMAPQFPEANPTAQQKSAIIGSKPGLVPDDNRAGLPPKLPYRGDLTIQEIAPRWLGIPVRFENIRRISPTSKTSAAGLKSRTYGTIIASPLPPDQILALKRELLVDDSHPALSIKATKAWTAAESGDFLSAGAVIASGQIEGLITRMVALTDAASIMVPRGTINLQVGGEYTMIDQVILRLDADPVWVRHDLGVYRLPGK